LQRHNQHTITIINKGLRGKLIGKTVGGKAAIKIGITVAGIETARLLFATLKSSPG
jgi:hypothetical protein